MKTIGRLSYVLCEYYLALTLASFQRVRSTLIGYIQGDDNDMRSHNRSHDVPVRIDVCQASLEGSFMVTAIIKSAGTRNLDRRNRSCPPRSHGSHDA